MRLRPPRIVASSAAPGDIQCRPFRTPQNLCRPVSERHPSRFFRVAACLAVVLAIGVAVAALWFLAAGGFKRDSSGAVFDELVALVGESRPTEGRLSGGFE